MKFEEFEKQCQENLKIEDNTCVYDDLFIDGLEIEVYKLDDGSFSIDTSSSFFRQGDEIFEHRRCYQLPHHIGHYVSVSFLYYCFSQIFS